MKSSMKYYRKGCAFLTFLLNLTFTDISSYNYYDKSKHCFYKIYSYVF